MSFFRSLKGQSCGMNVLDHQDQLIGSGMVRSSDSCCFLLFHCSAKGHAPGLHATRKGGRHVVRKGGDEDLGPPTFFRRFPGPSMKGAPQHLPSLCLSDVLTHEVGMIKSDLCRLVMMYKLGGYYFDTDPWYQRNAPTFLQNETLTVLFGRTLLQIHMNPEKHWVVEESLVPEVLFQGPCQFARG